MSTTFGLILFGAATVFFGLQVLRIVPTFFRLLAALVTGAVKWPGPRVHDSDRSASAVRERLGIWYEHLYPTFAFYALGLVGAFVFSLSMFLSSTPWLRGYIRINSTWSLVFVTFFAFAGGYMSLRKVMLSSTQVETILSDLADGAEPRAVDGHSSEAEYAIEHPLLGHSLLSSDSKRALDLYYESVRCHQDGNEYRALALYQEATRIEPSLHENAREMLVDMAQDCSPEDAGAICYWLGVHSEYLLDLKQAAAWYQKAIDAYREIGYRNRESRAHCNLGNVRMQMRDPSAMEEFESAIALNPKNGTAHLNIARTYYSFCGPGDPRYERALDAFADAIVADPVTYGPRVISSMRELGYTWKEDLDEVTRRFEAKVDKLSDDDIAG